MVICSFTKMRYVFKMIASVNRLQKACPERFAAPLSVPGRVDSLGDVALGFFRDDATFHLPNLITDLVHKLTRVGDDLGRARSSVT